MDWSEPEIATLRKLWAEGLSASQIARSLGRGRTRNAVIGKVHRIGLAVRKTPHRDVRRRPKMTKAARVYHVPPPMREAQAAPLTSEQERIRAMAPLDPTLSVTKLSRFTCRHPIGDPKLAGFAFCGRTCEGPYCAEHKRLNYAAPQYAKRMQRTAERLTAWLDEAMAAGL